MMRRAWRRFALMVSAASLLAAAAACSGQAESTQSTPSTTASRTTHAVKTVRHPGCNGTAVREGDPPSWAISKENGFQDPNEWPYAVSRHHRVVAVLFAHPLAVHRKQGSHNKIRWFVNPAHPDTGESLHVRGHPAGASHPTFSKTFSSKGEGSAGTPSYVEVPKMGCWRFKITWDSEKHGHSSDRISLRYRAHGD